MQMMTYMDIVLQNKERLGLTIVKPGVYFISMSMNRVLNLKSWADIDEDQFQKTISKTLK